MARTAAPAKASKAKSEAQAPVEKIVPLTGKALRSPLNLRANILEAIEDAQQFRERQVQLMISELARVAKISLWDIEGTLLAVKVRQAAASLNTHLIG